jgi:hypothetical protein
LPAGKKQEFLARIVTIERYAFSANTPSDA